MELMFLVYAVENLTYNSGFWYGVFFTCMVASFLSYLVNTAVKYLNLHKQPFEKVISTTLKECETLTRGSTFVLDSPIDDLDSGKQYTVSSIYRSLGDVRISGKGTNDYDLNLLEAKLCSQEHKTITITPDKLGGKLSWKAFMVVGCISLMLHTFLPSRQTAIYMAGAYLIQEVATSDSVQELGKASYNAAVSQLNKWSSEVPELAEMVADAGLESAKKKAVEVIGK